MGKRLACTKSATEIEEIMSNEIRGAILEVLASRKMKQTELGRLLRMSQSGLHRILHDKRHSLTLKTIARIVDALNMEVHITHEEPAELPPAD